MRPGEHFAMMRAISLHTIVGQHHRAYRKWQAVGRAILRALPRWMRP